MNYFKYSIYYFIFICSVTLLFLLPSQKSLGQEINAIVDLVTEGMDNDHLVNVQYLKSTLENYINSNQFSNVDWEGPKIPVNISLQLTATGQNTYSANMFIASKRTISPEDETSTTNMMFEDKGKWNFEYTQGLSLSYDFNRYDNFSSLIDFYMLIIIGLDLDTYGELDGDQCFQRARRVFDIATGRNAPGWETYMTAEYGRLSFITDVASPRFDEFRKLIFEYYVDGIDMLADDRAQALRNIGNTIHKMADFKEKYFASSHFMDSYFFTKCFEICELFKGYKEDPKIFRDLMFLDPTNTVRYEASRDGK